MIRRALRDRLAVAGVSEVVAFGSNPGALRMLVHARARMPAGRPLVVVLHGCGQRAAAFAAESGGDTAVAATGGRVRAWDAAAEWDRSNDFLADLAGAVGLNVDQVDQMFREAAAIRS